MILGKIFLHWIKDGILSSWKFNLQLFVLMAYLVHQSHLCVNVHFLLILYSIERVFL